MTRPTFRSRPPRWRGRLLFGLLALVVTSLVVALPALDFVRAAGFVVRAAGMHGPWPDRLAAFDTTPFEVEDVRIPSRRGALRARIYRPRRPFSRTILLTPGVHKDGIDEARLAKFARDFAAGGVGVVTAELPDLLAYRITPALPDLIEDSARWIADQRSLAPDGRVGLVGISFSGGLSVVAAGRPSVRDRVAFTLSFGGHGDLARTLRYLCTGVQPDGTLRPPHDYGTVIILLNAAHLLVPPAQVDPLRSGIRTFLIASSLDMTDKAAARREFDRAVAMEDTLDEPARTLLHHVNTRNVKALGPILLPEVNRYADDPALSAERSPAPRGQVLLLHGTDDNVIPAIESTLLGRNLAARGTPVHVLLSGLITHAEVDRPPTAAEVWRLIRFWARTRS